MGKGEGVPTGKWRGYRGGNRGGGTDGEGQEKREMGEGLLTERGRRRGYRRGRAGIREMWEGEGYLGDGVLASPQSHVSQGVLQRYIRGNREQPLGLLVHPYSKS